MNGITNNSTRMMEKSMDFLWTKQSAILDNISNAETPNYKTKTVTFEETFENKLKAASKSPRAKQRVAEVIEDASWKVSEPAEATRMDDNSVNVTEQSVELVRTAYQLQYTMQSISSDLAMLRTAITG